MTLVSQLGSCKLNRLASLSEFKTSCVPGTRWRSDLVWYLFLRLWESQQHNSSNQIPWFVNNLAHYVHCTAGKLYSRAWPGLRFNSSANGSCLANVARNATASCLTTRHFLDSKLCTGSRNNSLTILGSRRRACLRAITKICSLQHAPSYSLLRQYHFIEFRSMWETSRFLSSESTFV